MTFARRVLLALFFFTLIALHYSLRPALGWRAGIDFLVVALLLVAVRTRPGAAALIGFAIGIVADAMVPEAFGAGALALTIVGYTASWLKAAFFADNILLNAVFVFAGKWMADLITVLAEHRLGGQELVLQLVLWSPLAAAVTAVVGIVVLLIARPLALPERG
ncbi:MAG: rod shape-determining protein MreD [Gemmatimonadaceae bacterium]|nr:rod shape-determining protein MreD [Gemmatimonadaceae bacterium]